jgi:TfoX/Sxy family transcriptional regulator of competence genes
MASDQEFVDFILDQLAGAGEVSAKKMFGEYGIFFRGKMVALVCDNRFLVKPTEAGRAFIGEPVEAPPYPGAKPCFLIEDRLEEGEWLCELVRLTEPQLPVPKKRKKRKK